MKDLTLRYLRDLLLCAALILSTNSLAAAPGKLNSNFVFDNHELRETVVYITKTGKKYHNDWCRYLSQSKIKTTLKKAVAGGMDACKVCKP
ncbi:hypothetical protein [Daejeonella sp.]|uniref:hypothetical protein n=1 Tax=Daejeonella sp. TaxID=2805397 RepID=UPI0030BD833A